MVTFKYMIIFLDFRDVPPLKRHDYSIKIGTEVSFFVLAGLNIDEKYFIRINV